MKPDPLTFSNLPNILKTVALNNIIIHIFLYFKDKFVTIAIAVYDSVVRLTAG